jgi:hypothetical protein
MHRIQVDPARESQSSFSTHPVFVQLSIRLLLDLVLTDHRAYAMPRKLAPIVQRFGGFKASNHHRKRGRASAGHSRPRCGSCVLCTLDRFGLLDNWDGMRRGERAFCYHLTRSSSYAGRASHRSLRTVLPFVVPAGAARATPNSESLARPSLRLLSVSSHRNLPYRFILTIF